MTAFPTAAPSSLVLPRPGEASHDSIVQHFQDGKIALGLTGAGDWFHWDLNRYPHGLIGGRKGAGKSRLLEIPLYLGLLNRDMAEVVVCDARTTDFTWSSQFPNAQVADSLEAFSAAIGSAHNEMGRRYELLNRRGAHNLRQLRDIYEERPALLDEDGPAPKRLLLLIDDIEVFLAPSGDNAVDHQRSVAWTQLEAIARFARAAEINLMVTSNEPSARIVGTTLKQQAGLRCCVGAVDEHTSRMIFGSSGAPAPLDAGHPGRAVAFTNGVGFQHLQIPALIDPADQLRAFFADESTD